MAVDLDVITSYCSRVEFHRGKEVATIMANKLRPRDAEGHTVWSKAAAAIPPDVNLDDFMDWCFKEALPGLPFLNTLPSSVDKFVGLGQPITLRKEVHHHVKLMLDRFKRLLEPRDGVDAEHPTDVLFDSRYEFHPVFASEMAQALGLDIPEDTRTMAAGINECMPYYLSEMKTLLKDWIQVS